MSIANAEFDNTFVTIHNQEIDIHYRKKNIRLALDKVAKIYLAKKKSKYASWIPGLRFFLDEEYNLCIKTNDDKVINMEIKASEKQFFIDPIAMVRKLNKNEHHIQNAS